MSRQRKLRKHETLSFNNMVREQKTVDIIPKSKNQENYVIGLCDPSVDVVIAYGPAGTGKSYLAMKSAIKALKNHTHDKIILTRPAVNVDDEKHGFLPGDINDKMSPYVRPLFDILREHYSVPEIKRMIETEVIELSPLAFMRGRSLKNAWIVADEMQSTSPNQMKMLLTRLGENSKLVITGDLEQNDRKYQIENGLNDLITKLHNHPHSKMVVTKLADSDIQRHPLLNHVLMMYD